MKNITIIETEVLATPAVQRHLDRNPRVIEYRGDDVFFVRYDASRPIPRILGIEARDLGLAEIGGAPYKG